MSIFKFRLTTLLRLCKTICDERAAQLAEAHRIAQAINERMAYVGNELGSVHAEYRRAARPGIIDLDQLTEAGRWEFALRARHEELGQQLEVAEAEIQCRQQEFADARRDVRVLENLRDRLAERHHRSDARRETKQLDEVAQRCFARSRMELNA